MVDLTSIFQEVSYLIKQAGQKALSFYSCSLDIKDKGGNSPVTQADIESEKIILAGLKKYNYAILSEETTDNKARLEENLVWIVDPLDGTKDFINKTDEFTIMIGLVKKGQPVLGLVYQPVTETLYYAIKDRGAFVKERSGKEKRIIVSNKSDFKDIVMFSSRFHHSEVEDKLAKSLGISNIISRGSSLKICQIAAGQGELNMNPTDHMSEWDLCAADIILTEAGGKLTDMKGEEIKYNKENVRTENGYVASNRHIHKDVIKTLELIRMNPNSYPNATN